MARTSIIIATADKRHCKTLKLGEAALYTDEGDSLQFKRGGHLAVQAKKFTISNAQGELMSLLALLASTLERSAVVTSDGPKPLSTRAKRKQIAERLGSLAER